MRIWDIDPKLLCTKHLHEYHDDIHALWSILVSEENPRMQHPEVARWKGKLQALHERHDEVIIELARRGYNHTTSLDYDLAKGQGEPQTHWVHTIQEQLLILRNAPCLCIETLPN